MLWFIIVSEILIIGAISPMRVFKAALSRGVPTRQNREVFPLKEELANIATHNGYQEPKFVL